MKSLVLSSFLLIAFGMSAQPKFITDSVVSFQKKLNLHFADSLTSPLKSEDRAAFRNLDFFEIDSSFHVKASLVRSKDERPFAMPTTTQRKTMYKKFGVLHFEVDGKPLQLNVYQNVDVPRNPLYKNHLFLPFTDRTSGVETYGGGRYIDLLIPEGDTIILDFNKAYNPYCAYNPKYSCPLVPRENDLNVEIRAGVKRFEK